MIFEVDKRDGKSKGQAEWVKRSKTVRRKKLRCEGGGERGGRQGWGKGWQQQWRAGKKESGGREKKCNASLGSQSELILL